MIRYGVDKPYILAVGTREPRKNLALLIKTFLLMKTEGLLSRHTLVAVGQKGWRNQQLEQLLRASVGTEVKSLGHVPSPDLPALYTGCDVFVFPSIYEGFGIPVSEARACGARVVATDIPETREAGDDATIYVSPTAAGIRDGIVSALAQASIAPYRAARDWQSSARILADLLTGTAASSLKFSEI